MSGRTLVVIGDALLDRDLDGAVSRLSPEAPVPVVDDAQACERPGGAALAAVLAARHAGSGLDVVLIAGFAADGAAGRMRGMLADAGVEIVAVNRDGETPQKIRVRAGGHPLLRLDRGGAGPDRLGELPGRAREVLEVAAAVLVADYGRGMAAHPQVREVLAGLVRHVPVVWDPHPRGPAPVPGVRLAVPNAAEAARATGAVLSDLAGTADAVRMLRRAWAAAAVTVTLGERGALVDDGSPVPLVVPAVPVTGGDTCGAGDCFAAVAAVALAGGALVSEAVTAAVAGAGAFVAAGGAQAWRPEAGTEPYPAEPARRGAQAEPAARAGTVVATGGCFDLLHAGHVSLLASARRLGDRLVVLINSDASVRRRKGPGRPLQPAEARAAVLRALDAVDEVIVFDENTPIEALERLRPDVWVKGGDYAAGGLPEAGVLARWGGQAVLVPYLAGHSTTALVDLARRTAMQLPSA